MKDGTFSQLSPKDKKEFKDKTKGIVDEELKPLVEQGIVKSIADSKPNEKTRDFLKKQHGKLKEKFLEKEINYSFAGDMKKLDELVLRKRKNLNKPLSVMINGCEVLLSIAPFIYFTNADGTDVNEKLDKLIEEEKNKEV